MKTSITLFALFTAMFSNLKAQEELPDLTYEQTQDISYCEKVSNGTDYKSYVSKDGSVLKLGDALIIGRPSTNTNQFTHIFIGKMTIGGAIFSPPQQASGASQAEEVIIDRIYVYHAKASRKSTLGIFIYIKNPKVHQIASMKTVADLEKALQLGEIINPNGAMTREQAILKLKEAKDLTDLGIYSQSKYDSIKTILTPIITGQ